MTKTMKITYTALFAAIATVLMYFEFPVPLMPPFLKIDLSGAAILIGAFIFGIGPGIAMALIKDLIHLTMTQTGGSGELQDFILMVVLVVIAVSIYKRHHSRKGALIGCLAASAAMACVG
ncbi:MAG: ECF transporter S component, partial [Clostridiaceae bacterium]|nr:ECF transporter S component [Clostridiaceae bacterium]